MIQKYACRAELSCDVIYFLTSIQKFLDESVTLHHFYHLYVRPLVPDETERVFQLHGGVKNHLSPFGDTEMRFTTDIPVKTLYSMLDEIPDSHVMIQSFNVADEYTGERCWDGLWLKKRQKSTNHLEEVEN